MSWLARFWRQENRRYRNFQIAFTILTLNFFLPALSYVFAPETILEQLSRIGVALGADPYTFPEDQSRLWRYLGAANVMTLAFMCFLLQLNLRRFYVVLLPLTFLKAYNATLFLGDFLVTGHPAFLAVALFDYLTSAAFVFFAVRAHRELVASPERALVPALVGR